MKLAVISVMYNEEDLVRPFLLHYSLQVDRVFLVDNGSTDQTMSIASMFPNVEIVRADPCGPDTFAIHLNRERVRAHLAGEYDYVVMVDADEIVVPKGGGSIRDRLMEISPQRSIYRADGWQMFPAAGEKPFDPRILLTIQRRHGFTDELYSKPCIVRPGLDVRFDEGMHSVGGAPRQDVIAFKWREFLLLHYAGASEEIFVKRTMQKQARWLAPGSRQSEADLRHIFKGFQACVLPREVMGESCPIAP